MGTLEILKRWQHEQRQPVRTTETVVLPPIMMPIRDVNPAMIALLTGGTYDVLGASSESSVPAIFFRGASASIQFGDSPTLHQQLLEKDLPKYDIAVPLNNSIVIFDYGKTPEESRVVFVLPINRHQGSDHTTWITISQEGIATHTKSNFRGGTCTGVDPYIEQAALLAERLREVK